MNQRAAKRIPKHILQWLKRAQRLLDKQNVPTKNRWLRYSDKGVEKEVKIS